METDKKTAAQILTEAANLLEQEGKWHQGNYFKQIDNGCAMCAHGAIAYCGNEQVKNEVDKPSYYFSHMLVANIINSRMPAVIESTANVKRSNDELKLAHQIACVVGLTADYNDNPKTTKQDVINKLRQAANDAQELATNTTI